MKQSLQSSSCATRFPFQLVSLILLLVSRSTSLSPHDHQLFLPSVSWSITPTVRCKDISHFSSIKVFNSFSMPPSSASVSAVKVARLSNCFSLSCPPQCCSVKQETLRSFGKSVCRAWFWRSFCDFQRHFDTFPIDVRAPV